MSIPDRCCIEGCGNKGEYPLFKIEGQIKIKKDLVGSIPRDWKLCKEDFYRILKGMRCCIEGCNREATYLEVSQQLRTTVKRRFECSHYQLCLIHSQEFSDIANQTGIKREPSGVEEQLLPPQKKQAEDEDTITENDFNLNSDTSTEVHDEQFHENEQQKGGNENDGKEIKENKEEIKIEKEEIKEIKEENKKEEEIKKIEENKIIKEEMKIEKEEIKEETHCCISSCNEKIFGEVPILKPLHFHICETHLNKIIKLWKIALLMKQVILDEECLQLIDKKVGENTSNPLYHYTNKENNDGKCALCCGLYSSEEIYHCSFCPFSFCVECYKHLCLTMGCPQQFISNKARWKCFVCYGCEENQMQRNVFIKEQLTSILDILQKKLEDGCLIGTSEDEIREFIESVRID